MFFVPPDTFRCIPVTRLVHVRSIGQVTFTIHTGGVSEQPGVFGLRNADFSGRVKSGVVHLRRSSPTVERTRGPHRNPAGQIRASKMWAV